MKFLISILVLGFGVILQGCVAVQTFPTAARAGDTITLAVGSPDGMTKANTTAQFVSDLDPSNPINLTIRSILRLRPDNTSKVALFDPNIQSISNYTKHSAWIAIIIIDLPQGLPQGRGVINISTLASYFGLNVNDKPIAIDILPGAGYSNPFNYDFGFGYDQPGDLSALEPLQQIIVSPTSSIPLVQYYGAAEIKINAPMRKIANPEELVPDGAIRIVMDDKYSKNVLDQVQISWSRVGEIITVNFVSPTATMTFNQTRFSVVLRANGASNQYLTSPGPSVVSVNFYDQNGHIVTEATPTVTDYDIYIE